MNAAAQHAAGDIPELLLARLSTYISERIGLNFPPHQWPDLQKGLRAVSVELGFGDTADYAQRLLAGRLTQQETEVLASHLTIGETYFFREMKTFEALEQTILPELIEARRGKEQRLRLWSAGCSSGEEPYSLAILLRRLLPDLADWHITILATDINPRSLEKAAAGEFGEWSFREPSPPIRELCFRKVSEKRYALDPAIRKMVTFEYLNLAEDSYPSLTTNTTGMDVVLCRNVFIYFGQEKVKTVIGNLRRCMIEGGWLIVAASEVSQGIAGEFKLVAFPGMTAYRKGRSGESAKQAISCAEPPEMRKPEGAPKLGVTSSSARTVAVPREENTYPEALKLYHQGRYEAVIEKLSGDTNPARAEVLALYARASANLGDLPEALIWCERALAVDKMNPRLYYLQAMIQQEQGAPSAVASLRQSLYLDSNFALAHYALGNLLRQQGHAREAASHYRNALDALRNCEPGDELPESDGLTAGRLAAIISTSVRSAA